MNLQTKNSNGQEKPTDNLDWLEGKHVKLWPYSRGFYPRDIVYRLWSMVEKDKAQSLLMWPVFNLTSNTPIDVRGDLTDFAESFLKVHGILLIIQDKSHDELAGFIWFDDITPKFKAMANIFVRQKYWGECALEAGQIALRYIFAVIDVQYVWCFTPWEAAISYAKVLGFKDLATLPEFALINNKKRDVTILRITKESFYG